MSFGMRYVTSINGERYVYYQRLATDNITFDNGTTSLQLYNKARSVLSDRIDEGSDAEKISKYFYDLRDREFKKEIKLLSEKFGKDIKGRYNALANQGDNTTVGQELIEAFNSTLNIRSVFERNLALIQETNGQKQLITWFPTYFSQAWKNYSSNIIDEIKNSDEKLTNTEKVVSDAIDHWVPEIVREALIYMFEKADTESGIKNDRDRLQKAYQDLIPALKDHTNQKGNDFVQSFIDTYNLDELISKLEIEEQDLNNITGKIKNFKYKEKIGKQAIHIFGGSASENLSAYIAEIMRGVDPNFKSNLTGKTGQKADVILTFDIPTNTISDWIDQNVFGHREDNVKSIKKLEEQLQQFSEGFIVYTNAKNIGLGENIKKSGGFSAGKSVDLETWDTMMHTMKKRGRDLIFSAAQLVTGKNGKPGAIGEDQQEKVSMMFARAISAALFDDFDTVGIYHRSGVQSIHVLYLNGIYFPLSFYFNLLGEAFHRYALQEDININDLIKVDIQSPEILFPTMKDQQEWEATHGKGLAWNFQSHNALKNTKITYHFLKTYENIMRNLF